MVCASLAGRYARQTEARAVTAAVVPGAAAVEDGAGRGAAGTGKTLGVPSNA
jgi:hypothetical protein